MVVESPLDARLCLPDDNGIQGRSAGVICNWAGQDTFDEAKGLTPGNLYYCKRFYSLYNQLFEKVPQVGEIFKPLHAITGM